MRGPLGSGSPAPPSPSWCSAAPASPRVPTEPEAFARVVVDSADLRTGPGVSFRVIYSATAARRSRSTDDKAAASGSAFSCPTDAVAYAMGEQVEPFAVTSDERTLSDPVSSRRLRSKARARASRCVGGMLNVPIKNGTFQQFGYMEVRPQLVLDKTFSLEAFIGDGLTADGAQLFYGAASPSTLPRSGRSVRSSALGGGGLSVIPKSDSFILQREDLFLARAGGGFIFALRNRILVRIEASNFTLFTAEPDAKRANRHRRFRSVLLMKKLAASPPVLSCASALVRALTVRPQERAVLADPIMQFDGDPMSRAGLHHAIDNREGSVGGPGVSGGGCGCNWDSVVPLRAAVLLAVTAVS